MESFTDFWPWYLRQHRSQKNRRLHIIGTCLYPIFLAMALMSNQGATGWILAAIVVPYAFAWIGHYGIEKNRPATLRHPLWSLWADHKMAWMVLGLKMDQELIRLEIASRD